MFPNLLYISTIMLWSTHAIANFDYAPPSFTNADGHFVPVDVIHVDLDFKFNIASQASSSTAEMRFALNEAGYPFFEMGPEATKITLNDHPIPLEELLLVETPDGHTKFRTILRSLQPGVEHVVQFTYRSEFGVSYQPGSIEARLFLNNSFGGPQFPTGGPYWGQSGPSNLEYDDYSQNLHVEILGATSEHKLVANGDVRESDNHIWDVRFPDFFTGASFFVHIFENSEFIVMEDEYIGANRIIPLFVYGTNQNEISTALNIMKETIEFMERDIGPFGHPRMIALINPDGGGMEFAGATRTPLRFIAHEVIHSWFGRGMLNARNSGWMDEAMTMWARRVFPRQQGVERPPVNLSSFSPYNRATPDASYTEGELFLRELDYELRDFSQGEGLKAILRNLYAQYSHKVLSTEDFRRFIFQQTGIDFTESFRRYVYGLESYQN